MNGIGAPVAEVTTEALVEDLEMAPEMTDELVTEAEQDELEEVLLDRNDAAVGPTMFGWVVVWLE